MKIGLTESGEKDIYPNKIISIESFTDLKEEKVLQKMRILC